METATPTITPRCRMTLDPLWLCNCVECAAGRQAQPWRYRQPTPPASQSANQPTVTP